MRFLLLIPFLAISACSSRNDCGKEKAIDVAFSSAVKKFSRTNVERRGATIIDLGDTWKISFVAGSDIGGYPIAWVSKDACVLKQILSTQ
ncbi:hypothetical protein [Edaphosphingomonas haloaromaticamans]|uniref:hypothetical protein n=1 Tax=Edaphosphingomonas haloaromaticamans TaxID=653954 RepID=UPI0011141D97|nr:hypothetical protein [Sphingomonas haloaromaticamans]